MKQGKLRRGARVQHRGQGRKYTRAVRERGRGREEREVASQRAKEQAGATERTNESDRDKEYEKSRHMGAEETALS